MPIVLDLPPRSNKRLATLLESNVRAEVPLQRYWCPKQERRNSFWMNIALPAFVVFLLLLPGFIFRARFKLAERTSLDFSPFGRVAADAILWAIFAHILWLALSFFLFSQRFEPAVLLKLLSSAPTSQTEAISAVGRDFGSIAGYFSSLFLAAIVVPSILRSQITKHLLLS